MHYGHILIVVGLFLALMSPIFRKEGVRAVSIMPIWRAREYFSAPGVVALMSGQAMLGVGLAMEIARKL
jgi:hypothetical protein